MDGRFSEPVPVVLGVAPHAITTWAWTHNELAALVQAMKTGESRVINGQAVERLPNGAFRIGEWQSPPRSRTRPAGAPVQATARYLIEAGRA